ncbi:TPA: elongation factor Tu [Streptococcus pneumoniae]|nr:elongation factor Tu [Streptococcus pneumoniae]
MKERRAVNNLYLVKDDSQLDAFRDFVVRNTEKLEGYQSFLKNELAVYDLPQAVIWSDLNAATQIIRESAVPAYTNNRRMVMTLISGSKRGWLNILVASIS